MKFSCTRKKALLIIRVCFGLAFSSKGLGYLAALLLLLSLLARYKLSCYQTTLLLTISALADIGPVWFSFYRRIPLPRSRIWTKGRTQQNPISEIRCQNLNQKRKQPRTCFPKSDFAVGQNLKKLYQLVCQMTYIFFTSDFPQLFFHSRFFTAAFRNPQPNQTGPIPFVFVLQIIYQHTHVG